VFVAAWSGLALSLLALFGCRSMAKEELESELLALDKNARLRELGLKREQLPVAGAPGVPALELVHAYIPAATPEGQSRTPVVLVHGTPSTLFTWGPLAFGTGESAGLAAQRDVHLIEVLGHGVAPAGPEPLSFQACADYVVAAVRALGLERAFLVGQSYGGEFAWRAACDAPELFEGLVLISSSGLVRRDEDWLPEEVVMRENSLAGWGWAINSRSRVRSALEPHYRDLPADSAEEFYLVCCNASNWRGMIDLARDENGSRQADLASLQVPTLLVWGEDDAGYVPEVYAKRFEALIPDAQLVLIEGTGHYSHEERPAEVGAALESFFERVEAER
jgi:pimeloyl-ACP methyl ester carboxylesterase